MDLMEHGSSVWGSWVSEDGEDFINNSKLLNL